MHLLPKKPHQESKENTFKRKSRKSTNFTHWKIEKSTSVNSPVKMKLQQPSGKHLFQKFTSWSFLFCFSWIFAVTNFAKAHHVLLTSTPGNIFCRDKELAVIENFIKPSCSLSTATFKTVPRITKGNLIDLASAVYSKSCLRSLLEHERFDCYWNFRYRTKYWNDGHLGGNEASWKW